MRRLKLPALLTVLAAAFLVVAATAQAAPGDPWQYQSSFTGGGLLQEPSSIAVDHSTGDLLVLDNGKVDKFDPEGNPVNFSKLGSPQIEVGEGSYLEVDNSGGPSQGDIAVFSGYLHLYNADGTPRGNGEIFGPGWFYPSLEFPIGFSFAGGGIDPEGNIWVASNDGKAAVLNSSGVFTGKTATFPLPSEETLGSRTRFLFNRSGDIYAGTEGAFGNETVTIRSYDIAGGLSEVGPTGLKTSYFGFKDQSLDPATGDIYAAESYVEPFGPVGRIIGVHDPDPPPGEPYVPLPGLEYAHGVDFDPTGQTLYVSDQNKIDIFRREPASAPRDLAPLQIDEVRSRGVVLKSSLIGGGAPVTYHFEYGADTSYGSASPDLQAPRSQFTVPISSALTGLQPGTTYHVRLVASNSAGTTYGEDAVFTTYGTPPGGPDPCPNALARKQTSARSLPDCRAFELVSAANPGGHDVESSLVPGQSPFPGFPGAHDRVLYATHGGSVPGPWHPTNKGPDPYIATRTESGWQTQYAGLPADIDPASGPFSSALGEADGELGNLAFGGAGLCSPCFSGGQLETGIPVRLADGTLVQGMVGSLDPGVRSARPEGRVEKWFSGDGHDLVFASRYAFEPGAATGGDLTVYERDLAAGTTRIVSVDPSGATLSGAGISELGISGDGSRVLIGKRVSVDAEGNEYVHPYLYVAGHGGSIDLDPGGTAGVLPAGMSEDGSTIYFTTTDSLLPQDQDPSADLYEAQVDPQGLLSLHLLSGGGATSCNPVSNGARTHWNSAGAAANCDPLAVGGGGGVSGSGGVVYFLSPEQLDGSAGTLNQPNLYRVADAGAPRFVATLEPDNPLVLNSIGEAATRHTADFQTSASGDYAAFVSALTLAGTPAKGIASVYLFDAGGDHLECVSCDRSGTTEPNVAGVSELAPNGLNLLDNGELFFTTKAQLLLNDANGRRDVYEWAGGAPHLISSGSGPFDSALLSVSADGTDAFFFTHDVLAPNEDHAGVQMKIYDARVDGGYFALPPDVPCAASDECHGAGTPVPPRPDIKTTGPTTRGNVLTCKKNQANRGGRCVKKKKKAHKTRHRKAKKHHGKDKKQNRRGSRNA